MIQDNIIMWHKVIQLRDKRLYKTWDITITNYKIAQLQDNIITWPMIIKLHDTR